MTYEDLKIAYENTLVCPEHAGVLHLFADKTATFYEHSDEKDDHRYYENLRRAIEAIESAINMDKSYAKYHCTKSRLVFLRVIWNWPGQKLMKLSIWSHPRT